MIDNACPSCGGPSLNRPGRWKSAEPRPGRDDHDHWLVDAVEFRKRFLRGLQRLHHNGEPKLNGEWSRLRDADRFETWLEPLNEITWHGELSVRSYGSFSFCAGVYAHSKSPHGE